MGMYTELIFGASLKDLPKYVIEAFDTTINKDSYDGISNEAKEFIEKYEINRIFYGSSYYFGSHINKPSFEYDSIGDHYVLSTRANCKNYRNQIENFIEFITPYVEYGSGSNGIIAYVQYETAEFPTLYDKDGNRYDWYDRDKVSSAEKNLEKMADAYFDLIDDTIKDYHLTEEIIKENGFTLETFTVYDSVVLAMKEIKRRWDQTYDMNYRNLQNELYSAKRRITDLEFEIDALKNE